MNPEILRDNWRQLRPKIQSHWVRLSDSDLESIGGDYNLFVNRLAERYGFSRRQAEGELDVFFELREAV